MRRAKTSKRTVLTREEAIEKVEWDMMAERRVIRQNIAKVHLDIPFIEES